MAISPCMQAYLEKQSVNFQTVSHLYSETMWDSAVAADLLPAHVAKGVLLKDQDQVFVMAVIPAKRRIDLDAVNNMLDAECKFATKEEVHTLFEDCQPGAVPAIGAAFGIETVWDSHLNQSPHVYFEAGDHETLVDIEHESFERLFIDLPHDDISVPV